MKRSLLTVMAVVLAWLVLIFLMTGLIELFLWTTGVLGLHHQLGTSSQTTENYAAPSGTLAVMITSLGFVGVLVTAFKHFNCHVNSPYFCWRFGHAVPGTSFRACHAHHPDRETGGEVTAAHIHQAGADAVGLSD